MTDLPPDPFAGREPWDRQPGEGPRPYAQFVVYRDMGPGRSIKKASEKIKNRSLAYLYQVAHKNRWTERASLYDLEMSRQFNETVIQRRKDMATRHYAVAANMLSKASERLLAVDVDQLSLRDLAYWVETAVKVQRLALGSPTDILEAQGKNTATMTEEELRDALVRVQSEIAARVAAER